MKKLIFLVIAIALSALFFSKCYYDNEEALYPSLTTTCDTTNVTFSGTITSILSSSCWSCHSDANAAFGGGVHLQSVNDVISNSAKIMPAINQTGSKPMPPNGKLKPCLITQFSIWIKNGMKNN